MRLGTSLWRVHLGLCGRDQEQRAGGQCHGRKRSEQTRLRCLAFGALHKLSPLFRCPGSRAGYWFKADSRLSFLIFGRTGVFGHQNDTPPAGPSATDPVPLANDPTTSECSIWGVALATTAHTPNSVSRVLNRPFAQGKCADAAALGRTLPTLWRHAPVVVCLPVVGESMLAVKVPCTTTSTKEPNPDIIVSGRLH